MPVRDPRDPRFVNPHWSAPPEQTPPHQVPAATYAVAALMPVLLLLLLAAPVGIALAVRDGAREPGPSAGGGAPSRPAAGEAGAGDPYFPDYGSSGYDAIKYTIAIRFDPDRQLITGTTTITARATQDLASFYYDLVLATDEVTIGGEPARVAHEGLQDVKITPETPIKAGAVFEAKIDYSGRPADIAPPRGQPWSVTKKEWTAAGEPESAAWWYPSNDHPSDPALMDVSVQVPQGYEVLSVGRLASRDTDDRPDTATWHWVSDAPMATYLNFVSIGQYEIKESTADGRQAVYAVSEQLREADRRKAFAAMERSPAIIKKYESWFGPYPFDAIGGVVPAHRFGFGGLETQTRPVYGAESILDDGFASGLVAHELAHMWFGDQVTVHQWNDIFDNEGYASWAQWAYLDATGGEPLNDHLERAYRATKDHPEFWKITMIDPGPDHLFDVVYTRGPMLLQALRNRIGDKAFFKLARQWAQQPGSRSLEEWMVTAQSVTSVDLAPFFAVWILGDTVPAHTRANGLR
ncbi:MAG TPA: M1 family metallopeptidase [Microlunatus sp.]|nr:M1 family metallopeptidase [Microlunatus sp.]